MRRYELGIAVGHRGDGWRLLGRAKACGGGVGWGGGQERDDRRAQLGTACSGSSHRQPLFQSSCLSHHPSPRLVPSCPVPSNPVPPCRVPCGSEEKKTRSRAPAVLDRSLEMGGVGGDSILPSSILRM